MHRQGGAPTATDDRPPLNCWVVTDGRRGMENQCLGLAEALGDLRPVRIATKRVRLTKPYSWMTYGLLARSKARFEATGDAIEPPWPDLLIACGRAGMAASLIVKGLNGKRTFRVQTQDPKTAPHRFDLVVPPIHDGLTGRNVIPTMGSMHRISPSILTEAAREFQEVFAPLPRPLAAVLIGGRSNAYRLSGSSAARLCHMLEKLARSGVGLAVTPSRRTDEKTAAMLRHALGPHGAFVWNGYTANPYFAMLALADYILVTADSVNMVAEAASTGKPVYILPMAGGNAKFRRFHSEMESRGFTRPFEGRLENWQYEPLSETARVASILNDRLNAHAVWSNITGARAEPLN